MQRSVLARPPVPVTTPVDQIGIGHRICPGRGAVIASIEGEYLVRDSETLRDRRPVAGGAEDTVQDHERRPVPIVYGL